MKPNIKLYISSPKVEGVFGRGKFLMLKAIKEEGSIQKAAESLGRSYRKAWGDIKRAEDGLGKKLIERKRGGAGGGKTTITEFGIKLLKGWEAFDSEIDGVVLKSFNKTLKKILC